MGWDDLAKYILQKKTKKKTIIKKMTANLSKS